MDQTAPAVVGVGGLAVLLLMVQGTGGLRVELLGADLLLVVAGYCVTYVLLDADCTGRRLPLIAFYRRHVLSRVPLLLLVVVLTTATAADRTTEHGFDAARLMTSVAWWQSAFRVFPLLESWAGEPTLLAWARPLPGVVDPRGSLWLVGLLLAFAVGWPLVLAALRRTISWIDWGGVDALLASVLVVAAFGAALVGPMRAIRGADLVELAAGPHVRLAEWLMGAAGAAVVLAGRPGRPPTRSRLAGIAVVVGVVVVLAAAVVATLRPVDWLRHGGATSAAFGAALVLGVIGSAPRSGIAQALARGLPLELGRSAYPLLLLHLPIYALTCATVPDVRPAALLFVGGPLAWLISLLLHDGLLQRLRLVNWHTLISVAAVLLAAFAAAFGMQAYADPMIPAARPTVLVLGGVAGHQLAATLDRTGTAFRVVDGTRPDCGLLTGGAVDEARVWAMVHAPAAASPCVDWRHYWRNQISAARPDLLVVDLTADAALGPAAAGAAPCDAVFRERYRALLDEAAGVWTADSPARGVLLASVPPRGDGPVRSAGRCLNLLLAEAVAGRAALVGLDTETLLCPARTCQPVDHPNGPAGGGDVGYRLGEPYQAGMPLEATLQREVGPERASQRLAELAACLDGSRSVADDAGC